MFLIRMGVPEMLGFWETLTNKVNNNIANKADAKLYKKIYKALLLLSNDPKHPSLDSHEIKALSLRYGMKVFESYLENHTPNAGRLFWVYGPCKDSITIIGLEPHPNDKSNAYKKIKLSLLS